MITKIIRWLARHELSELEYSLAMERARTAELTQELRGYERDNIALHAENERLTKRISALILLESATF